MINEYVRKYLALKNGNKILTWSWNNSTGTLDASYQVFP